MYGAVMTPQPLLRLLLRRRMARTDVVASITPNVPIGNDLAEHVEDAPDLFALITDAHRRLIQAQADLAYWASIATHSPTPITVPDLSDRIGMPPARLSTFLASPHAKRAEQDVARAIAALSPHPSPRNMPATVTHLFPKAMPVHVGPDHPSVPVMTASGAWTVTSRAHEQAVALGLTPEEVVDIASDPVYTCPDSKGRAMEHCKHGYSALVPHSDPRVVIGIAHSHERHGDDTTGPIRVPSAKSGGPGRRMPSTVRELVDALVTHGFRIDRSHAHPQATHPNHPGHMIVVPSTPSDHRSYRNLIAGIRRDFGIDITR